MFDDSQIFRMLGFQMFILPSFLFYFTKLIVRRFSMLGEFFFFSFRQFCLVFVFWVQFGDRTLDFGVW